MFADASADVKEEAVEPDAKKRRLGEGDAEFVPPPELEVNFTPDARPTLTHQIGVELQQATVNVVPTLGGKVLMPLTDGGLQYLLAGARANVAVKAGRYMYEVRIMELQNPMEARGRSAPPQPRQLVRIGFSAQCASLFLGETADSICFDSEGFYTAEKTRKPCTQKFSRDNVLAVILNLDPSSPNANTMSLFKDGVRAGSPQAVPESLRGKPLFPQVTFKLAAMQVNWGPIPLAPLPFKCPMLQSMASDDAVVAPSGPASSGKYEVVFPVGLPDEGTFDWLEGFLEKNPEYCELSERKITEWAASSGLWRPKAMPDRSSNDRPEMNYGIPLVDDGSIRKIIYTLVAAQPRNYVVMEVEGNLLRERRIEALHLWQAPHFKKVCKVVVGQPTEEFRQRAHARALKEKQAKADAHFRHRQLEEKKKRVLAEQQKRMEDARRLQMEAERKAEEDRKLMEEEKAALGEEKPAEEKQQGAVEEKQDAPPADLEAKPDSVPQTTQEAPSMEAKLEVKDEVKEEVKEEPKVEAKRVKEEPAEELEEEEKQPPTVELTEDEKAQVFLRKEFDDIVPSVMTHEFLRFTLPDGDEGFDEIQYEWQGPPECFEYMDNYKKRAKLFTKVDEIMPSDWFQVRHQDWMIRVQEWMEMQNQYKEMVKFREMEEIAKKEEEERENAMRMEQAAAEAMNESVPPPQPGVEQPASDPPQTAEPSEDAKKGVQEKEPAGDPEAKEPLVIEPVVSAEELKKRDASFYDVEQVVNILDVVNGEPLFAQFSWEDWLLLSLRFEIYLMAHSFKRDIGDPERFGVHEHTVGFYYQKYYRKPFSTQFYGVETIAELIDMIKDSVKIDPNTRVLEPLIGEDLHSFDVFVKNTEANRRKRKELLDAGNEDARLNFVRPEMQHAMGKTMPPPYGGYYKGVAKGGYTPRPPQPTGPQYYAPPVKGARVGKGYYQGAGRGAYAPAARGGYAPGVYVRGPYGR